MITLFLFLISVLMFGALGGWLAAQAELPVFVGVLIGSILNVVGIVFLAGVWAAEWLVEACRKPTP